MGEAAVQKADTGIKQRLQFAWAQVKEIVGRIWIYVLVGIAIGAGLHDFIPEEFFVKYASVDNLFAVPSAVLIGIPLYSNATGVIPIVEALLSEGVPIGTVLALMMSVAAISLPEMIILRKVLKPQLIATFVGILFVSFIGVGFMFNVILVEPVQSRRIVMKTFKILGSGCKNCANTADMIEKKVAALGVQITLEKITDMGRSWDTALCPPRVSFWMTRWWNANICANCRMGDSMTDQAQLHSSIVAMISLSSGIAANHPAMGQCQLGRFRKAGIPEHRITAVIEIARHIRNEVTEKLDFAFDEAADEAARTDS